MRLICIVLVALICGTVPALAQLLSVDNLYDRVQERFADNNGVPIQYVVTGQGPLVLFIHGYPDQWFTWRHQMVALADTYTVAAISQRGYNKSGRPKGVEQYAISHLTADVAAVMRHLGRQQATIVGHDWGGIVAWHFAQQHPEMVKGLVSSTTHIRERDGASWPRTRNSRTRARTSHSSRQRPGIWVVWTRNAWRPSAPLERRGTPTTWRPTGVRTAKPC